MIYWNLSLIQCKVFFLSKQITWKSSSKFILKTFSFYNNREFDSSSVCNKKKNADKIRYNIHSMISYVLLFLISIQVSFRFYAILILSRLKVKTCKAKKKILKKKKIVINPMLKKTKTKKKVHEIIDNINIKRFHSQSFYYFIINAFMTLLLLHRQQHQQQQQQQQTNIKTKSK